MEFPLEELPDPPPEPVATSEPTNGAVIDGKIVGGKSWTTGYIKPRKKVPGAIPISCHDAARLNKSAMMPIKKPSKVVLTAMGKVGLKPSQWNEVTIRASQEVSRFMSMQLTGEVLLVRNFNTLDMAEKGIQMLTAIAENGNFNVDDRAFAASMIPKGVDAFRMLSAQIMEIAEKLHGPLRVQKPTLNLPPNVAVQVNMAGIPAQGQNVCPANAATIDTEEAPEGQP